MAADDSSELSSLSSLSAAPSEDESEVQLKPQDGILRFFHKLPNKPTEEDEDPEPALPKREPSPPHEYVLADNKDIAFIVMFRDRFREVLPKSLAPLGPQELEREVVDTTPGDRVEHLLCAILGLLLNRKQDVKPGHYKNALEDAISTHKTQWPAEWEGKSPLVGGASFSSLTPVQRLTLLRTLILWALVSSDAIRAVIGQSYKHNRREDDLNSPLSVQPWGADTEKRRYFLIEGSDDTSFRIYRESNPAGFERSWWSVAGTIDELKALAEKIAEGGPKGMKLSRQMLAAVPRFEATEEKRRRREYRQIRKQAFTRPEPGFSMYEGRTRGKRMKYTYSDEEDFDTDSTSARRSHRNTRHHSPAEPSGPVVTASGRQVRRPDRMNADPGSADVRSVSGSVKEENNDDIQGVAGPRSRPQRSAAANHGLNGWASKKRKSEEYESGSDENGSEQDYGGDDEDEHVPDESEEDEEEFRYEDMGHDADNDDEESSPTMVVKLRTRVDVDTATGKVYRVHRPETATIPPPVSPPASKSPKSSGSTVQSSSSPRSPTAHDIADVISVAVKERTPEPAVQTMKPLQPSEPPGSVAGADQAVTAALAFRGSPEKPSQVPPHLGMRFIE